MAFNLRRHQACLSLQTYFSSLTPLLLLPTLLSPPLLQYSRPSFNEGTKWQLKVSLSSSQCTFVGLLETILLQLNLFQWVPIEDDINPTFKIVHFFKKLHLLINPSLVLEPKSPPLLKRRDLCMSTLVHTQDSMPLFLFIRDLTGN